MANSDKDILITPGVNQSYNPKIEFKGFDNDPITLEVLSTNDIAFTASEGVLLSITNNLAAGTIFAVSDPYGVPSIDVNSDGVVNLAPYHGNVVLGSGRQIANTPSRPKLILSRGSQATRYDIEANVRGGISDGNYGGIAFTQGLGGGVPLASIRIEYASNGFPSIGFYTRSGTNAESRKLYLQNDGRLGVNTSDFSYSSSDNSSVFTSGTNAGIATNKLFVSGSIQLLGNSDAIVFGRGTSTFLKDEELAFGSGGGWYMQDGTYLRVRGSKILYNDQRIRSDTGFRAYGDGTTSNVYAYDASPKLSYLRQGNNGWQMYGNALANEFFVSGETTIYYPTKWQSVTWPGNATASRLRIFRNTVHTNASWHGAFSWELKYHPSNWGHWGNNFHHVEYMLGSGSVAGDPVGGWQQGNYAAGGSDIIVWLKGGTTYYWDCPDLQGGFQLTSDNAYGPTDIGYGPGCVKDSSQIFNWQGSYSSSWCPLTSQRAEVEATKNRFYHFRGFAAPNLNISGSKTFKIDHPLDPKNKYLVHSSIEGPRVDLVYRGKAILSDGIATVNMDEYFDMISGTWKELCRDGQAWISGVNDFVECIGTVDENGLLTIKAKDISYNGEVSWMIIAERHDSDICKMESTDSSGKLIIEPLKKTYTEVKPHQEIDPDGNVINIEAGPIDRMIEIGQHYEDTESYDPYLQES